MEATKLTGNKKYMNVCFFYSVYNRYNILKQNLTLLKNNNISNIVFLIDKTKSYNLNNLKAINLVKNSNLIYKVNTSHKGSFCTFIDFFYNLKKFPDYSIFIEDDCLLTNEFFEFHNMVSNNLSYFIKNNIALVSPFGFNYATDNNFSLSNIDCSLIKGNLWGCGYIAPFIEQFFKEQKFNADGTFYLDLNVLNYFSSQNKSIAVASHNLISYEGLKDSRDYDQLKHCIDHPMFKANLNFKELNIEFNNNNYSFLQKHNFFRNNCIC